MPNNKGSLNHYFKIQIEKLNVQFSSRLSNMSPCWICHRCNKYFLSVMWPHIYSCCDQNPHLITLHLSARCHCPESLMHAAGTLDSRCPVWLKKTIARLKLLWIVGIQHKNSENSIPNVCLTTSIFLFTYFLLQRSASPPVSSSVSPLTVLQPVRCRRVRLAFAVNYHSAHIIAGEFEMTADVWHGVKT